jgi:hypothetical protein
MLKSMEEVNDTIKVVNEVDNPNLMSVDSTEPFKTKVDVVEESKKEELKQTEDKVAETEAKTKAEAEAAAKAEDKKDNEADKAKKELEEAEAKKKELEKEGKTEELKGVDKRIGELTKKWRTAERERDYEKAKRLEAEEKLAKFESTNTDKDNPKPKRDDFDFDEDYIEALTEWKVDQKLKASAKKVEKEVTDGKEKEEITETWKDLDSAIDAGRVKYTDFDKLVVLNKDLVLSTAVVTLALDTEVPADVLYWLAKNPDKSAEISGMSPIKAAREVTKIEREVLSASSQEQEEEEKKKLEEEKKKKLEAEKLKKKDTTKAPAPITPVKADGVIEKDPENMTAAEYRAWREKGNQI